MKIRIIKNKLTEAPIDSPTYGMSSDDRRSMRAALPKGSGPAWTAKTVIQMIDPTGATSIPDIPPAYAEYEKSPTFLNGVLLTLAVLAAIPVAGRLAKVASKAPKLVRYLKQLRGTFSSNCAALNESRGKRIGCALVGAMDNAIASTEKAFQSGTVDATSRAARGVRPLATVIADLRSLVKNGVMYVDDEGRQILIAKLGKNVGQIFYKSTGTGTPGLKTTGQWLPIRGLSLLTSRGRPHVWYVKIPGKVHAPGSPIDDISKKLFSLESELASMGIPFHEAWTKMDGSIRGINLDKVDTITISAIGKFNKWAEEAGAVWSRQGSAGRANLIGTSEDGYEYAQKFVEMFSLKEMKHIYK